MSEPTAAALVAPSHVCHWHGQTRSDPACCLCEGSGCAAVRPTDEAASVTTLKAAYEPGDTVRCTECHTDIRLSSERDWRGDLMWRHVITGDVRCHYKATPPPFRAHR
jgi:hypothetical protein